MSEQQNREIMGDIKIHLGSLPRGAAIDSLALATEMAYRYSCEVSEVRKLVRWEADAARVVLLDH
jgi:hypothetical protein